VFPKAYVSHLPFLFPLLLISESTSNLLQYTTPPIHVPARTRYTEPKRAPGAGGVVLKVSRSNQLVGGKQTQFEYAIADNKIYYDISFVDCAVGKSGENCPGWHTGLSISSPNVGSTLPFLNPFHTSAFPSFFPIPFSDVRLMLLRIYRKNVRRLAVRKISTVLIVPTLSILRCRNWEFRNRFLDVGMLGWGWIFG
jgi:hypothetical protein